MADLISVVVPAYNHENYIEDCLRSIADQSYEPLELIVVDDGSSDSTFERIQDWVGAWGPRFTRVVVERRSHEGVSPACAHGGALAEGRYIYWPGSDDLAKPEAVRKLQAFLRRQPEYALAVGDSEIIDQASRRAGLDADGRLAYGGRIAHHTHGSFLQSLGPPIDFHSDSFGGYRHLLLGNHIPNGYLIRQSAYEAVGGFNASMPIEDWHLMLQLSKRYKMKYFDDILYSYRRHPGSITGNEKFMLTGLARTFDGEVRQVRESGPPEARQILEAMVASRTRRVSRLRLKGILEYYVEKFGMGRYYATRRHVLEMFGQPVWARHRTYLAYGPGADGPLSPDM